jgi:hypothetical protein
MARKKLTKKRHRNQAHRRAAAAAQHVRERLYETDSTYLLKLIVVVIIGAVWLRLNQPVQWGGVPFGAFPVGLIIGLILVKLMEAHQSNRKILYAVLIIVGMISYVADTGIVI